MVGEEKERSLCIVFGFWCYKVKVVNDIFKLGVYWVKFVIQRVI